MPSYIINMIFIVVGLVGGLFIRAYFGLPFWAYLLIVMGFCAIGYWVGERFGTYDSC